jgi:hypothetical protein
VQRKVFAVQADSLLRGFVVWVPMFNAEEDDVPSASRIFTDSRTAQYWDGKGSTTRSYQKVLGLQKPAWDVYLIYGPDAKWEGDTPPAPIYWMHQLRGVGKTINAPFLVVDSLASRVATLMNTARQKAP